MSNAGTVAIADSRAHPDDAEFHAGGLAAIYRSLGHAVRIISLTNGDAGHHVMSGQALAERRSAEMRAAAAVIGAEYAMWSHRDGMLEPSLELRWQVIRELRTFSPTWCSRTATTTIIPTIAPAATWCATRRTW